MPSVGANDPVQSLLPVFDLADRAHGEERAIEIGEQLVGGVALVEEIERLLDEPRERDEALLPERHVDVAPPNALALSVTHGHEAAVEDADVCRAAFPVAGFAVAHHPARMAEDALDARLDRQTARAAHVFLRRAARFRRRREHVPDQRPTRMPQFGQRHSETPS